MKSTRSGVTLYFQFVSAVSAAAKTFAFHAKPFMRNFTYLGQRIYRSGEMYWMTFPWPWPMVTAVALIKKKMLVFTSKWETLIYSLQNLAAIPLIMLITWLDFGSNSAGNVFLANFLLKIRMCFFKVKHSSTMQYNRTKGAFAYGQGNRLGWVDVYVNGAISRGWLQTSACRRQI